MKQGTGFKVPIYGVKVRVFEGDPGQVAQTLGIECEGGNPEINQCDGAVFNHHNGSFTVVIHPHGAIGRVISHECLHLTDVILDFVGVRWEPASETHAYLLGFLMDRILRVLGREEKKVKLERESK